jgi:hypothetical protein
MGFQTACIERLRGRWKCETRFDEEYAALDIAFGCKTVGEMRPSTFPSGKRVDIKTSLEDIIADDALGVNVIRNSFSLGTIPNAKLGNVETRCVGRVLVVGGCEKWRGRNRERLSSIDIFSDSRSSHGPTN